MVSPSLQRRSVASSTDTLRPGYGGTLGPSHDPHLLGHLCCKAEGMESPTEHTHRVSAAPRIPDGLRSQQPDALLRQLGLSADLVLNNREDMGEGDWVVARVSYEDSGGRMLRGFDAKDSTSSADLFPADWGKCRTGQLPTSLSVNQLPQDVSVAGVTGGFFKQMHQDPAKIHWRFVSYIPTKLIKAHCSGHDAISADPGLLIGGDSGLDGIFWPDLITVDDRSLRRSDEAARGTRREPCAWPATRGWYRSPRTSALQPLRSLRLSS